MDRRDGEPRPPIYDIQPLRFLRDLLGITDEAVEASKSKTTDRDEADEAPPDN